MALWLKNCLFRHPADIVLWALLFCCFLGLLHTGGEVGFIHDDGVYLVTAKALATGNGYMNSHLVLPLAQTKYPILYPLILSMGWLINPDFPQNMVVFHAMTMGLGLLGLVLFYYLLKVFYRFPGWLALLAVALILANFNFLLTLSSVMAEAPYLFFSMLTLWVTLQYLKKPEPQGLSSSLPAWRMAVLIVLSALTFHTRLIGVTLILAITAWFLMQGRRKAGLIYFAGSLLLTVAPWLLWIKLNTPPPADVHNFLMLTYYCDYGKEFFLRVQREDLPLILTTSLGQLIHGVMEGLFALIPNFPVMFRMDASLDKPFLVRAYLVFVLLLEYALGGYYLIQFIQWGREALRKRTFAHVSVPGLYLLFYLAGIFFWSYQDHVSRFLTVIMPLLWLYFLKPVLPFMSFPLIARRGIWLFPALVTCIGLFPWVGNYQMLAAFARSDHPYLESRVDFDEYRQAFAYIRRALPSEAPIAAGNDVVFYLWTNHPTYLLFAGKKKPFQEGYEDVFDRVIMESMAYYGVQYLVLEPMQAYRGKANPLAASLVLRFPQNFQEIFRSSHGWVRIFKYHAR